MIEFENEIQHESFGLIEVSRGTTNVYNKATMFGCDYHPHQVVRLTIKKNNAMTFDPVMGKRYHGKHNYTEQVSVDMSMSQWGELLSSMNYGEGVPCTVTNWDGVNIEPYREAEQGEYEYEYNKVISELKDYKQKLAAHQSRVNELIAKLPKKVQEEINREFYAMNIELTENIPFHIENMSEVSEKIVSRAKQEINSYMDFAVHQTGLKAIAEQQQNSQKQTLLITEFDNIEDIEPIK